MQRHLIKDRKHWKEIMVYIVLMVFYLVYSLAIQVTTTRGVMLDFLQQLRPYFVFYLTWVLAPQFNPLQKRLIKWVIIVSFFIYLVAFIYNPSLIDPYAGTEGGVGVAESAALGQLALCCTMIFPNRIRLTATSPFLSCCLA